MWPAYTSVAARKLAAALAASGGSPAPHSKPIPLKGTPPCLVTDQASTPFQRVQTLSQTRPYRRLPITPFLGDLSTEITSSVNVEGTAPMLANLNAGGFKMTNLATPTNPHDAARLVDLPTPPTYPAPLVSSIPLGSDITPPGGSNSTNSLTSVSLTAGTWMVFGNLIVQGGVVTNFISQVSLSATTFDGYESGGTNGFQSPPPLQQRRLRGRGFLPSP